MGIKLSTDDQVRLLQTFRAVNELVEHMGKVDFDIDLVQYAIDLAGVGDVIKDSCVLSLKTNQEIEEEIENERQERDFRSYQHAIYHENRI
jgi:hypothetical protein